MSMRFNSLKDLGKGSWKIHSETPINLKSPAKKSIQLASKSASSPPHEILWTQAAKLWGGKAVHEYRNAIPSRDFRLDIAFPDVKLAVEVDGWQFHGKFKSGFHKDREKQNLLTENGWRILRFSAKAIFNDVDACITSIQKTLSIIDADCSVKTI